MEDAVKLLVEHLVRPVLPRLAGKDERHMTLQKQRAVAQQVHTAVILYNYYHRKMCPRLTFADAKRFFMCASLSVGEDLFPYLRIVNARENYSGDDVSLSVTDREGIQACEIAEELDATKDYPDMEMWPIGKVAVLLLDQTKKKCLIEYGADTKGVWSIIEKEYDVAAGISHSTNQPTGQESTNTTIFGALDGPLMLQQLAISEVQRRTGGQVDKNKTQNDNMHQDVSPPMLHKECILQERSIQCDMDIQTILNEGKMTPKVLSIGDKYKETCSNMMDVANSSGSGDGGQTMSTKRKTLKEVLHIHNKCQELDEICNVCEWILPRYTILPSVADGMFCASVHLTCPDFDMSIAGNPSPTPREARCSAAVNMMVELHKKAKE
ncbi:hypothetical protein ACQ4PT_050507 [Festuca glaucescens]